MIWCYVEATLIVLGVIVGLVGVSIGLVALVGWLVNKFPRLENDAVALLTGIMAGSVLVLLGVAAYEIAQWLCRGWM